MRQLPPAHQRRRLPHLPVVTHHHGVGSCLLVRTDDGQVIVERADPLVMVSAQLLAETAAHPHPAADVGEGWVRVRGQNRTVTYRLQADGYCLPCDAWLAVLQ